MGDPLSVVASAAGLISLGVRVSQSLVSFYVKYEGQDEDIKRITRRLNSLCGIFESFDDAIKARKFRADEQPLVDQINDLIQACGEHVIELQERYDKFTKSTNGVGAALRTASRRLACPCKQATLGKRELGINEIRQNLSLALE